MILQRKCKESWEAKGGRQSREDKKPEYHGGYRERWRNMVDIWNEDKWEKRVTVVDTRRLEHMIPLLRWKVMNSSCKRTFHWQFPFLVNLDLVLQLPLPSSSSHLLCDCWMESSWTFCISWQCAHASGLLVVFSVVAFLHASLKLTQLLFWFFNLHHIFSTHENSKEAKMLQNPYVTYWINH